MNRNKLPFLLSEMLIVFLLSVFPCFSQDAFPLERLHGDWLMQDCAALKMSPDDCFKNSQNADLEQKLLNHVNALREKTDELVKQKLPGNDPKWKTLYFQACEQRRKERLTPLVQKFPKIVYAKHSVLGGSHYAYTEEPTDAQRPERNGNYRPGAQLCLLSLNTNGNSTSEVLYETKEGFLRDPDVSYDGQRILFSMRKNDSTDDFHLYELSWNAGAPGSAGVSPALQHEENAMQTVPDRTLAGETPAVHVRQLTDGLGFADIEPCYLPDGDILFTSTRCMQIVDCWWTDVSNFYVMDKDGYFMRRIGFDQVHTNYPAVLDDGRVVYTRWDYNDRGQIYPQALFVMNYDGTAQTEFYGNNSWFPTTILHARGVPNSQKVVAIATGHHSHQRGKLIMLDRSKGTQENSGAQLICPPRNTPADRIDAYGQGGEQFQYPYALDETNFIVTYIPEGARGNYDIPFGIYWMDIDGNRELLAFDPKISCGRTVPLVERTNPQLRTSPIDYEKQTGTYYVQDVYAGPGLKGIERGTVKSLRVVALEFRAAGIGSSWNFGAAGDSLVSTPVSIENGTWDVKRVLGTVPVEEDGSAYFEVPARTPVYFQLLDENEHVVQSMRSWSTLQPGEMFSCVGCHEDKAETLHNFQPKVRQALKKRAKRPQPFFTPDRPAEAGFSFVRDVQPIFDIHCVQCHFGSPGTKGAKLADGRNVPFSLLGNSYIPQNDEEKERRGRAIKDFSEAYFNLTRKGRNSEVVNWLDVQSAPPMIAPYTGGAAKSRFISQFNGENPHNGVKLGDQEKRVLACWIDLLVPYCGSYTEANLWTDAQKAEYDYYLNKRLVMEKIEHENLVKFVQMKQSEQLGDEKPVLDPITVFDAGGREKKKEFIDNWLKRKQNMPIHGLASDGQNEYRNLAFNPESGKADSYPLATSNSEFGMRPEFAAYNAIDGKKANQGHGSEFPSWGPNKRTDLWWNVEFGRPIETDKLVIWIRADFPHDSAWKSATLQFSDGSQEKITLQKTDAPQTFTFSKRTTTFVKITDLVQDYPLGWCAFTEVEVWGSDPK